MTVNILGEVWKIKFKKAKKDPLLKTRDGYTDRTIRTIFIAKDRGTSGFHNYDEYQKSVIRHEIIHAFLIESGLDNNWQHADEYGHDETMIDCMAMQHTKLQKAFAEVGAI